MLQLSEKMPIFVPSVEKDWRHRGELLSFDPLLLSLAESAHIYTCRCELIFILTYTGIAEPSS